MSISIERDKMTLKFYNSVISSKNGTKAKTHEEFS